MPLPPLAFLQSSVKDVMAMPTPRVKFLRAEVYGPDGWNPRPERIRNPSWHQIEQAILRLDRFRYPWVWLFLTEAETKPDEEELQECLTIMGGREAYFLELNAGEHDQLTLLYPDAPQETVEVWESDQGMSVSAREVTADIDLVLRVAKHFAATGEPLPDAPWATPKEQRRAAPIVPQAKFMPAIHRSPAYYALIVKLLVYVALYCATTYYLGSFFWGAVGFVAYSLVIAIEVKRFLKARRREWAVGALMAANKQIYDLVDRLDKELE